MNLLNTANKGMLYGLIGVTGFSLTPPATRMAVMALDPVFTGLGRAVVAGCLAALILLFMKVPFPGRRHLKSLFIVAICLALLFPLLTAWSMQLITSSHSSVILGILPLATAIAGALRTGERPPPAFWVLAVCGSLTVIIYSLLAFDGKFQSGDLLLFAAILAAATGYSEGARLTAHIGGWQTICWALVIALPFLVWPFMFSLPTDFAAPASAWFGFFYLSVSSQLLSFFPWFYGLALGGITRVSQLMLLMPFMTLFASQILLDETVTPVTWLFASVIIVIVAVSKQISEKSITVNREAV